LSSTRIPQPVISPPMPDFTVPAVSQHQGGSTGSGDSYGVSAGADGEGAPILDGGWQRGPADIPAYTAQPSTGYTAGSQRAPLGVPHESVAVGPGGVIGHGPTTPGNNRSGRASSTAAAPRPVIPGATPATMLPPVGQMSSGRGVARTPLGRQTRDPRDQWFVPEGLPPVIEPRADPIEFDPGPGVIGLDR
jgi:hypothetical protein